MSKPPLQPQDFEHALKELDSFIDVSLDDLMQIHQLAEKYAQLRQSEQLALRAIMTANVTCVHPQTSLKQAVATLLDLRISGLPVVDNDDRLVGVVTEADFLTAMGIPCHHPSHTVWQTLESMFRHRPVQNAQPGTVAEIMVSHPVTLTTAATLHDVIETMKQHNIKRVIIVNAEQKVEGIVTRSNLVRVLLNRVL